MKNSIIIVSILSLLIMIGCSKNIRTKGITIEEINLHPEDYYNKECILQGLITQYYDVPLLKHDIFKINDGTGEIWVYTERGALPDRIEVRIRGTLKKFIKLPFKLPIGIEIDQYIKLQNVQFTRI